MKILLEPIKIANMVYSYLEIKEIGNTPRHLCVAMVHNFFNVFFTGKRPCTFMNPSKLGEGMKIEKELT